MCAIYRVGEHETALGRWTHLALGPLIAPEELRSYLRAVAEHHLWAAYLPGVLGQPGLDERVDRFLPEAWPVDPALSALTGTAPAVSSGNGSTFDADAVVIVHEALTRWDSGALELARVREREHLERVPASIDARASVDELRGAFERARHESVELALTWEYR